MRTLKQQLAKIYKAKDCTDTTDCEVAMNMVRELAVEFKLSQYTTAMCIRLASLSKRKFKLEQND